MKWPMHDARRSSWVVLSVQTIMLFFSNNLNIDEPIYSTVSFTQGAWGVCHNTFQQTAGETETQDT